MTTAREVIGPVKGEIRACYLNADRSNFTHIRSLFGPCGGELFFARAAEGSGRHGTYVCGGHVHELDDTEGEPT